MDETLAQTLPIGVYILGLGAGALAQEKKSFNLNSFFKLEIILCIAGLLLPLLTFFFNAFFELFLESPLSPFLFNTLRITSLLSLPFFIGYLSGKELPFLMSWGKESHTVSLILGFSYIGNLLAGLLIPLYLFPFAGVLGSSIIIAGLNLACALYIIMEDLTLKVAAKIGAALSAICMVSSNIRPLSQSIIKVKYIGASLAETNFGRLSQDIKHMLKRVGNHPGGERHRSFYQTTDIVYQSRLTNEFDVYINSKPQFSSTQYIDYHRSMVEGFFNLFAKNTVDKILILGGGDGIIARYLLEKDPNTHITLVDLDKEVINLSKKHPYFKKLNKNSLESKNVNIINMDAFSYLQKTDRKKYDAIFIDFPLPYSLDLSKLYSQEFYSLVRRNLTDQGAAIFDAPLRYSPSFQAYRSRSHTHNLITSTLHHAGVRNWTFFGPYTSFFYFNKSNLKSSFNYELFPKDLSGSTFVNFIPTSAFIKKSENFVTPNSIFKPQRFYK